MLEVGRLSKTLMFYNEHVSHTATEKPSCSLCILQVSLLVVMEIGLFPLICGWWLDICSLVSSDIFGHCPSFI